MHHLIINNQIIFKDKHLTKIFSCLQNSGILDHPGYNAIAKQLQKRDSFTFSCFLDVSDNTKVPIITTIQKHE